MGDTSTYLGKAHAKKIMSGGKMDLALSNVFRTVTGESMGSKYPTRERTASAIGQILTTLLSGQLPTFANFYAKHVHSILSRLVHRFVTFKTVTEKLNTDFLPLRYFIAKHLLNEKVRILRSKLSNAKLSAKIFALPC